MQFVNLANADMLEHLKTLADDSVDACVCDPPYHLESIVKRYGAENAAQTKAGNYGRLAKNFHGKNWDGGDIAFRAETWAEVIRVLKPGGYLMAFSATRYYHRMATAIEDAGFEIREQIDWIFGSGFPKSHDVRHNLQKRGDPNADDWEGWGTALKPAKENICMARKPFKGSMIANVVKHRTGALNVGACRIDGPDEESRWPSNVIIDGSMDVALAFPGDAASFFYSAKVDAEDRNEGLLAGMTNDHATVKPTALMRWLCRLVTPKGGVVLDPFMGSGTTGKAAMLEGFSFIGVELDKHHFEICEHRINSARAEFGSRLL